MYGELYQVAKLWTKIEKPLSFSPSISNVVSSIAVRTFFSCILFVHFFSEQARCVHLRELTDLELSVLQRSTLNPQVIITNTKISFDVCDRIDSSHLLCRMMAHMVELLTAKDSYVQNLLRKERDVQGGISLEELYRLSYAQSLASDPLTWQVRHCLTQASCSLWHFLVILWF